MSANLRLISSSTACSQEEGFLGELLRDLRSVGGSDAYRPTFPTQERLRSLQTIEETIEGEVTRRRRIRQGSAGLAVAAAVAMGWYIGVDADKPSAQFAEISGQVEVRSESQSAWGAIELDSVIAEGTQLRTGQSAEVVLKLAAGGRLLAGEHTELRWSSRGRVLGLQQGRVEVSAAGTVDVAVAAGGTRIESKLGRFQVTIREEAAAPCVIVYEGSVRLLGPYPDRILREGETSGCEIPAAVRAVPASIDAAAAEVADDHAEPPSHPRRTGRQVRRASPQKSSVRASSLAAQNALFQRALSRERSGDLRGALSDWNHFLRKYPRSPLAEQARVQRATVAERADAR